ncbi:MAG TPA: glycosyltransferase family 2 protein [Acetobacteraceae bacterium]|nr:glycosyltransferase family 2 protein [Acetobacteraceae bacterium]
MDQAVPNSLPADGTIAPELAIVIPTLNERGNIAPLVRRLRAALSGINWEVIFVDDDSTDGTVEEIESFCQRSGRFRCVRRIGRRGLASAVIEGAQSTFAPFVAVMDADLQHDETVLVPMLTELREGRADLTVGSRYVAEGGIGAWDSKRARISRLATSLSKVLLKGRTLADPMSGFFMLKREAFEIVVRDLSAQGYKILLDIVASSPRELRVTELPYVFGVRHQGSSKLDTAVVVDFFVLLADKLIGRWVPGRFLIFATIGCLGFIVHMSTLATMLALGTSFLIAQSAATFVAIAANFALNNVLTYRDRRLKGWRRVLVGLMSFYVVCLVGAVANVGIASVMFSHRYSWWLAGFCGVLVGAVWNYAGASTFTWRQTTARRGAVAGVRRTSLAMTTHDARDETARPVLAGIDFSESTATRNSA